MRYLTAMALDQLSCSGDCVFGLVAKESDGLDVLGKLRLAELHEIGRCLHEREKLARGGVH